ncbi:hypothetical protein F5Y06DRAFT_295981 [Hypoxylon sp. FL0890]|nr:hypothetical protein F5Y06DRAFT_295981 [Hypoxylon sp. FL0890]
MASSREQSIFFRLPAELREQVYQYCEDFYMGQMEVDFPRNATGFGTLLQRRVSNTPALLQSCKKIKEEAEQWMYRHIHIEYSDDSSNSIVWMHVHAIGKPDLGLIRKLTLNFEDLVERPNLILNVIEHIFDRAPMLQLLEITWGEMVHCPLPRVISLEDNIGSWFPILAKAKQLQTLKLKGAKQEWATAVEEHLGQHNPEVRLEVELFDMETSLWASWPK